MRRNSFVVVAFAAITGLCASVASAEVILSWSNVGNAGNAGDLGNPTLGPVGAVAYEYRIGRFEVTNAQYAEFLNTVAASDPRGLFNANMGSDPRGGINRLGSSGSFTYAVRPNMGNKPVNFVSSLDALRMANWLTNGQGSGSTESGVYTLSGNTVTAITRDLSNPNQVFLPTTNEWYKAALHQPASQGGDPDNFWRFATQSNDFPIVGTATATGDIANPTATTVNWQSGAD
jgi:formylglycine-generating enzyme